jgi:Uma2 family endonuclease
MVNLTPKQKNLFPQSPKRKDLPTMYDLPSEEVGDSGLPDLYHVIQAQLLEETFQPRSYPAEQVFSAIDLNLYYDENNTGRYKRPDWFGVVGVSRLYEGRDLRKSYVIWQEEINPLIIVELLSEGTQREDLGQTLRKSDRPPTKWEVYEQILRVPYYVVYDGERDYFRGFRLERDRTVESYRYQEVEIASDRLWLEEAQLGLRLWQGMYKGVERLWLRFDDVASNLILTSAEQAEQAQQRAEQVQQRAEQMQQRAEQMQQQVERERQRADRLRQLLIENGIDPDEAG